MLGEVGDLAASVTTLAPDAFARLRGWQAGIRSSGSTGGSGSVSDPTSTAALTASRWGDLSRELAEGIRSCRDLLRKLNRICAEVAAPPVPPQPRERGLMACANQHGCPDDAWATKAGRCEACYKFRSRNNRDRTGRGAQSNVLVPGHVGSYGDKP